MSNLYRVQVGDSLSKIADAELGNMEFWPVIADLNKLMPPYIIHPGELILLPEKPGEQAAAEPGKKTGWIWAAVGVGSLFLMNM